MAMQPTARIPRNPKFAPSGSDPFLDKAMDGKIEDENGNPVDSKPLQPPSPKHSNEATSNTPVPETPSVTENKRVIENPKIPQYKVNPTPSQGSGWSRVSLPSRHMQYDFKELQIRRFNIENLIDLDSVTPNTISPLIDTIDKCLDIDARQLVSKDFFYLMYWERISSYPSTPLVYTWKSKYGNTLDVTVNKTNLDIKQFDLEQTDKLNEYYSKGLTLPTMRDMEILVQEDMDPKVEWKFKRAQYLQGSSIEEKISRLDSMGIEGIELINKFIEDEATIFDFGINESLVLKDTKFDPKEYIEVLEKEKSELQKYGMVMEDEDYRSGALLRIAEINDTIKDYKERLARGEVIVADDETVPLPFSLDSFFPQI